MHEPMINPLIGPPYPFYRLYAKYASCYPVECHGGSMDGNAVGRSECPWHYASAVPPAKTEWVWCMPLNKRNLPNARKRAARRSMELADNRSMVFLRGVCYNQYYSPYL